MKPVFCRLAILILALGPKGPAQAQYTFSSVDVPGAKQTYALGMNDAGQIVGYYNFSVGSPSHAFLLSDCQYTTIDVPGATSTQAYGINNAGQIVGGYYNADGLTHAFLLNDGE